MLIKKMVVLGAAAVLGLGLVAVDADAGARTSPGVTFTFFPTYVSVRGTLGGVHNSSIEGEEIGCSLRAYGDENNDPPNPITGDCWASDGELTYSCNLNFGDASIRKAIATLGSGSHLEFRVTENDGLCNELIVDNNSKFRPKNAGAKVGDSNNPDPNRPAAVTVTTSYSSGSLGSARTSADNLQYIGCELGVNGDGVKAVYCYARDASGNFSSCSSARTHIIEVMSAIKPDSWIYFSPGECGSRVEVVNGSRWMPTH